MKINRESIVNRAKKNQKIDILSIRHEFSRLVVYFNIKNKCLVHVHCFSDQSE